jgi:hypothetical protein
MKAGAVESGEIETTDPLRALATLRALPAGLLALVARQQRAAVLEDREALGDVGEPGVY